MRFGFLGVIYSTLLVECKSNMCNLAFSRRNSFSIRWNALDSVQFGDFLVQSGDFLVQFGDFGRNLYFN